MLSYIKRILKIIFRELLIMYSIPVVLLFFGLMISSFIEDPKKWLLAIFIVITVNLFLSFFSRK